MRHIRGWGARAAASARRAGPDPQGVEEGRASPSRLEFGSELESGQCAAGLGSLRARGGRRHGWASGVGSPYPPTHFPLRHRQPVQLEFPYAYSLRGLRGSAPVVPTRLPA